jgi:hypothetical protein
MVGTRIALALVAAIAILALVRGAGDQESREALAALSGEMSELREAFDRETKVRAALEREIARLGAELAARDQAPPAPLAAGTPRAPDRAEPGASESTPAEAAAKSRSDAFDPARLERAGFSAGEVERFRARAAEIELDRLYLRDQAQREGWIGTPRFAEENERLEYALADLRSEFDEGLYDWMLFAEGRPNRIAVTEVLASSAADSAGLLPGDLIVRYDDRPVFSAGELGSATHAGQAGAPVAVELQRGGETLRVFLPRGPLGVKLEPRSVEPPAR